MVFPDVKKEFDSIPQPKLLYKPWLIGITGPLWCWFIAYLSDRTHLVSMEGALPDPLPVHSGVPQVIILGLLLFLIYINNHPACTRL